MLGATAIAFGAAGETAGVAWPDDTGQASISAPFDGSPIRVGLSRRTAGAIDSLTWKGKQFVNSNDHGREFQSASFYDKQGGCNNPTEAGSARDGQGPGTTSQLLSLSLNGATLKTVNRMAYWLGPHAGGKACPAGPGAVTSDISDDLLLKTVGIGAFGIPNVISYDVTFRVAQPHGSAMFEALTGYMPPDFSKFWSYGADRKLAAVTTPQGAQASPLIFSTADGTFALGVVSGSAAVPAIYGHWTFTQPSMASPTVKWNCVFAEDTVQPGDHRFTGYLVLGSLDDVQAGLDAVCGRLGAGSCR